MTREELEGIRDLKLKVIQLREELRRLNMSSLVGAVKSGGGSHGSRVSDKVGNTAVRRITLENAIHRTNEEIKRRVAYIDSIPDRETRRILYCKCVCGFSFSEISDRVRMPESTAKMRYYRFFENFSKKPLTK